MKRMVALLLFLIGVQTESIAQNDQPIVRRWKNAQGLTTLEVSFTPAQDKFNCLWDDVKVPCSLKLKHFTWSSQEIDQYCCLFLELVNPELEDFIGEWSTLVRISLANGEEFSFWPQYNNGTYNGDKLEICLGLLAAEVRGYESSYRADEKIDDVVLASAYLFNQLSLYDIVSIRIAKQVFKPLFRSSQFMKSLVREMRTQIPVKKALPDVNNLDYSWEQKRVDIRISDQTNGGYKAEWSVPLQIPKQQEFSFGIEKVVKAPNRPRLLFECSGYRMLFAYKHPVVSVVLTLSDGSKYVNSKANLTSAYFDLNMFLDDFTSLNPHPAGNKSMSTKSMLRKLALYNVVSVRVWDPLSTEKFDYTVNMYNADGSTAELFGKMSKMLLEKTGAAELYSLTTPAPIVHPTTTPKPAQNATKTVATPKAEPTESLTATKNKYDRHIARYDNIAPHQLMYTPLALFTSRTIPMDDLVSIVDGAKGVGKVTVSTSSDGKQKSVTVHPTEFYCRLRGFEEVPCTLMSVGYDATDTRQIKTASFSYNLPASWKRGKVKEYAKAFSNDMHRIGMQWTEEKNRYVGIYEGYNILIAYSAQGDDNFIYVYVSYAE